MNDKLKYLGYSVVFQEVPDEVTLAINISGCPHKCVGCHSKYLWEYKGNYISDDLDGLIEKYKGLISCVCFMGGDQNQDELTDLLICIKKYKLKTALYTGYDSMMNLDFGMLKNLDYCKIGHYDSVCGGLDSPNTNQQMLKWNADAIEWEDITYRFLKDKEQ